MFVAAAAWAQHNQALADEVGIPPPLALKWTGKADLMMRQAQSAMRSLLRLQATRRKLVADPKAYDRGERIEHTMTVLMTGAIADQPPVSPDDPESQSPKTEILPRHPTPLPSATLTPEPPHPPAPVSSYDPESRSSETETQPRHPAPIRIPITVNPPRPSTTAQATPRPVSPHDPESHLPKTEIPPRHAQPTSTQRWRPLRPGYDFPLSDLVTEGAE